MFIILDNFTGNMFLKKKQQMFGNIITLSLKLTIFLTNNASGCFTKSL